jgi:hypothetical protein
MIQSIAMKTCVVFNIIVKKIKLKHPNLTSQILPECTSKSGRICKIQIFDVYLKTALDLNNNRSFHFCLKHTLFFCLFNFLVLFS